MNLSKVGNPASEFTYGKRITTATVMERDSTAQPLLWGCWRHTTETLLPAMKRSSSSTSKSFHTTSNRPSLQAALRLFHYID